MLTKLFLPLSTSSFYAKRAIRCILSSLHLWNQSVAPVPSQLFKNPNFIFETVQIEYCFYIAHSEGEFIYIFQFAIHDLFLDFTL